MILQRVSVSEQIFDDIVDKIRRREIVQGQKLVIKNLEHEYGVSSTPVRDALYMLKTAGFLEMKSSGTARVITMEYDDCLELVRINLGLVRLSFFLIMENGMAPKLLSGMEPLYEKQVELKDADSSDANVTFEGWYTTATFDAGSKVTQIPTSTSGNKVTLYAKWNQVTP